MTSIATAIKEVESVLLLLEQSAELCRRGLLRQEEATNALATTHQQVSAALPQDSNAFRLYDRGYRERSLWTRVSQSGYADPDDCRKLEERIALLRRVLNELEPTLLRDNQREKTQFYFTQGDSYGPKKQTFGIMKKATTNLAIVDLYLDEQVFGYIESLEQTLPLRLLTGRKKPIFQSLFKSFKAQRSNCDARAFSGCHDRFIVVDDGREVWQLGASINTFGQAALMINKVTDETERTRFLADLTDWWGRGEDLSI